MMWPVILALLTATLDGASSACGACSQLSPAQLRQARLELAKRTILDKLNLREPPRRPVYAPPVPLLQSLVSSHRSPSRSRTDDYFGAMQHAVVMLKPGGCARSRQAYSGTQCFWATFPADIEASSVVGGELWVHSLAPGNRTLVLSESLGPPTAKRVLSMGTRPSTSVGWYRFDVGHFLAHWVRRRSVQLELTCPDCPLGTPAASVVEGLRPFFVLRTDPTSHRRTRRSIDCTEGTTRCCRENFYLSFDEIGWDEWIIEPKGYPANYCRGTCLNDVSTSRYHHTTVMQRYLQSQNQGNVSLSLCCTPSLMSPISLIYIAEDGSIYQKSLPNMVVESCDCA